MGLDTVSVEFDFVNVIAGRLLVAERSELGLDKARMFARPGAYYHAPDESDHPTRARVFARHQSSASRSLRPSERALSLTSSLVRHKKVAIARVLLCRSSNQTMSRSSTGVPRLAGIEIRWL